MKIFFKDTNHKLSDLWQVDDFMAQINICHENLSHKSGISIVIAVWFSTIRIYAIDSIFMDLLRCVILKFEV